jgi:CBS domain-containing protein
VSVQALLDDYVLRYRHSSFPVNDPGGQLTGLVTLSRVKTIPPASRQATPVSSIAIPLDRLTRAEPDEPIAELLSRLASGRERRALVFDRRQPGADRLVGIVTPTDIARMADVFGLARAG